MFSNVAPEGVVVVSNLRMEVSQDCKFCSIESASFKVFFTYAVYGATVL